jgi:hypothetical protein
VTGVQPRRGVVVDAAVGSRDVVGRIVSLAVSVRRGTLKLALAGAAAAAVIVFFLLRHGLPGDAGPAVLTMLGVIAALAPPAVLAAFWFLLGQLLALPERLRALPAERREHTEELRRLVREARSRPGWTSVPVQLWKLSRLAASSRELLTPYAPLVPLVDPRFLVAVLLSGLAVGAELVVALVLLLIAALG